MTQRENGRLRRAGRVGWCVRDALSRQLFEAKRFDLDLELVPAVLVFAPDAEPKPLHLQVPEQARDPDRVSS